MKKRLPESAKRMFMVRSIDANIYMYGKRMFACCKKCDRVLISIPLTKRAKRHTDPRMRRDKHLIEMHTCNTKDVFVKKMKKRFGDDTFFDQILGAPKNFLGGYTYPSIRSRSK